MARVLRWATPVVASAIAVSLTATAMAATGWTVSRTPATTTNAVIYGAAARSDSDAWAVGTAFGTGGAASPPPIAYHWNGSGWALTATASLNGVAGGLVAVSSSDPTDAWAVGFTRAQGYRGRNSLAEHWNGAAWSVVAGVNLGGLAGVADLGPTNAWAVSSTGMVEHWDGVAWTAVSVPQPNPANTVGNRVTSMSASGPSNIWAVGTFTTPSWTDAPYSIHYDGTGWSVVSVPVPPTGSVALSAVTTTAPSGAWAVGQTGTETVVEGWDGTAWTLMPPFAGATYPSLSAAAARAADDVWVFGSNYTNSGAKSLLLLHWDGRRWSNSSSPVPAELDAAAVSPGHVWALGFGSANQPLILSHS